MTPAEITQDYLRAILHYDPETGVFTWLPRNPDRKGWNKRRAGKTAGTVRKSGYLAINLFDVPKYAHRLAFIWMGETMPEMVDHADGDKSNNRWANLRRANNSLNLANARLRNSNTSGIKGVFWDSRRKLWCAQVHKDGRHHHVGRFSDINTAAAAYEQAATEHFGEFARPIRQRR